MITTDTRIRVLVIEKAGRPDASLMTVLEGLPDNDFIVETASTAAEIGKKLPESNYDIIVAVMAPRDRCMNATRKALQKSRPAPIITIAERKYTPRDYPFEVRECLVRAEVDAFLLSKVIGSTAESGVEPLDLGRALKEFQSSGVRYLNVILSNADGIVIVNLAGKILFVNPAARVMLGGVLDGENHKFPYVAPIGEFTEIGAVSETGQHYNTLELRSVETVWEGEDARLFSLRDITSRKKAEEMLRISEERYSLAVRGSKDGLWDWDLVKDRIYFCPQWKKMLGFAEQEVSDQPKEWFSRIHKADLRRVKKAIERHLSGATQFFNSEFRILHKDGSYRWVLARGTAILNSKGTPIRIAGSQTDTTQRKKAERDLKSALDDMRFRPRFGKKPDGRT
jgi:PAS domain S-box-containing protein